MRAAPSDRAILQRSSDELNAFGDAMHLRLGLLLIQGETRSLLASTYADNVTNERKRGSLGRILMNKPASVEPAQLEDHGYEYCRGQASCVSAPIPIGAATYGVSILSDEMPAGPARILRQLPMAISVEPESWRWKRDR